MRLQLLSIREVAREIASGLSTDFSAATVLARATINSHTFAPYCAPEIATLHDLLKDDYDAAGLLLRSIQKGQS
jgi:hypothetical protein